MIDARGESVVLVELDALLDTRLPTLGKINPQFGLDASLDPRYFSRVIDDFTAICGVGVEQFRQAYEARDLDVLQASVITEIPFILNELVLKLEREALDTPFLSGVRIQINVFPYELDDEDKQAIALAVATRCGIGTEVECVYIPLKELTPGFVRDRYSGMFIYNFREWMKHQVDAFHKTKMPRVSVMAPALYYDKVPRPDEFAQDGFRADLTAFQLSEVGSVELFSLSLLPAVNFSMARLPGIYKGKPVEEEVPLPKVPANTKYTVR